MKQFTSILFCLVLVMGLGIEKSWGQNSNIPYDPALEKEKLEDAKANKKSDDAYRDKKDKKAEDREAKQEAKQSCSDAMKTYKDAKLNNPCPDAKTSRDCQAKIDACVQNTGVANLGFNTGDDAIDTQINSAFEMIRAMKNKDQNSAKNVQADRSCYSAFQSRNKDDMKERKTRRDQIIKDIEEANKEAREANAKLSEKSNDIKKDQNTLQTEVQEKLSKYDGDKRENLKKMNKELQAATKEITDANKAILEAKDTKEKANFEIQMSMTAFTEEKVTEQCKASKEVVRNCFKLASQGKEFPKGDTCEGFTSPGKGVKATTNLRRKIKQVDSACYEQSNQTVAKMKFSHAEKLRTVDRTIQDKQLQVTEANKSLATIKKDAEEENNEIDTQKAQKKTSLEQQMANIAERLLSLQKETADAVKASDEKIALLNLELNDLKAGALANDVGEPGSQFLFDNIANQANTNLSIITSASSGAYGACCSGKASKQGAEGSGANCLSLNGENAAAAKKSKSKDRTNN